MKLAYGNFEKDLTDNILGNGSLTVEGNVLKAIGYQIGDRAIKETHIPNPSESLVKVSVMARAVKGKANVAVDGAWGGGYQNIEINSTTSEEWTLLTLECIVPEKYSRFRVALGRPAGDEGEHETYYKDLSIEVDSVRLGANIVLAQGLIRLQNGEPSIRPAYKSFGIKEMSFNGSDRLIIRLNKKIPVGDLAAYPMVHVTGGDSPVIPVVSSFVGGETPQAVIKFSNGAEFINVSNMTLYFFFSVLL